MKPEKKKSKCDRSGDLGDQGVSTPHCIQISGIWLSRNALMGSLKLGPLSAVAITTKDNIELFVIVTPF
jgi:hypothetical protein